MPEFIQPCFKRVSVLVVLADTTQFGKLFHIIPPY